MEAFLGSVAHVPMWNGERHFRALGQMDIPVLLLWGAQDMVAPVSCAAKILELIPNSTLVTFERSTHLLLADEQAAAAALLLTFLDFPKTADLARWRFLLPYTPQGCYVARDMRKPDNYPGSTHDFLTELNYRPRLFVKLAPAAANRAASRTSAAGTKRRHG